MAHWVFVLLVACAAGACRYEEIWAGAEYQQPEGTIRVASQEPLCGCATLTNTSNEVLSLRGTFRGTTVGTTKLQPKQALRFGFDWAGPMTDDVYIIDAYRENGTQVSLSTETTLKGPEPWDDCQTLNCPFGDLLLNMASTGR